MTEAPWPPPPPTAPYPLPAEPVKSNWFLRNLAWAIPAGCLMVLMVVGMLMIGAIWYGYSKLKDFAPYRDAVAMARGDASVREALGEPVETGILAQINVQVTDGTGSARLSIPLRGPKGKGTLHVEATKSGGRWTITHLEISVQGRPEPIDLLKKGTVI